MTKYKLIQKLNEIVLADNHTIEAYVAQEALEYGDNPAQFFNDILSHGCVSGMISGLIYYSDTHAFFDLHYDEIEELRCEYESSTGMAIDIKDKDLKNTLAWFAFEQTAFNIANKMELGW